MRPAMVQRIAFLLLAPLAVALSPSAAAPTPYAREDCGGSAVVGQEDGSCSTPVAVEDANLAKAIRGQFSWDGGWHSVGPFPVGKGEFDGFGPVASPVESFRAYRVGGRRAAAGAKQKLWSELGPLSGVGRKNFGRVGWRPLLPSAKGDGVVLQYGDVDWRRVVQSQGMESLEFQAWTARSFKVSAAADDSSTSSSESASGTARFSVRCYGVAAVNVTLLNGRAILIPGDIYRSGLADFPIELPVPSEGTVMLRVRGKVQAEIGCAVRSLEPNSGLELRGLGLVPDIFGGALASPLFGITVQNTDSQPLHVDVGTSPGSILGARLSFAVPMNGIVASGQLTTVIGELTLSESFTPSTDCPVETQIEVSASSSPDSVKERFTLPVRLECRKRGQSFLFTFVDTDLALSQAGAVEPLEECGHGTCSVFMTLHGTGISARDAVDAYKHEVHGEIKFGLEKSWTLGPDRHGAHNWENVGMVSAFRAIDALREIVEGLPMFSEGGKGIDTSRVIFGGHSMGGHGALVAALHAPDQALAVVSGAPWIKKESYGDSNIFMRRDVGESLLDPYLKAVLEASVQHNSVDNALQNLKGVDVHLHVGTNDHTVEPYEALRFCRVFASIGGRCQISPVSGKEHWWWDSNSPNDGGVVNDAEMRKIFHGAGSRTAMPEMPDRFSVVSFSPKNFRGRGGITIAQPLITGQRSSIDVRTQPGSSSWQLLTSNVRRFRVTSRPDVNEVIVDGSATFQVPFEALLGQDGWQLASAEAEAERPAASCCGMAIVSERQFAIVFTDGSLLARQHALFLANQHFIASSARPLVLAASEFEKFDDDDENESELNFIFVSTGPSSLRDRVTESSQFSWNQEGDLELDGCLWSRGSGTGVLFVAPWKQSRVALVVSGSDDVGVEDSVYLGTPTIPPMVRSPYTNLLPDFVVTASQKLRDYGAPGFISAGWWNATWHTEARSSYLRCF